MNDEWPPLDTHAHIDPSIDSAELLAVRAVVFAATRSLAEFQRTRGRQDPIAVWGVGVHPGLPAAVAEFTTDAFRTAIRATPLVSEVGMERRSPVPRVRQRSVFDRILTVLGEEPRVVSVHSSGAASLVLDALEERPVTGVILHWWRGSPAETARAVRLGCFFSVNAAEMRRPAVIGSVPWDRLLSETDHPHGDHGGHAAPGRVGGVEEAIANRIGASTSWVRRGMWGNLGRLVEMAGTFDLFTGRMRRMLSVAPPPLSIPRRP